MKAISLKSAVSSTIEESDFQHVIKKKGVSIARFSGIDSEGHFLVLLSEGSEPVVAYSTIDSIGAEVGEWVVVAFDEGDLRKPIIIGKVHAKSSAPLPAPVVRVDGERIQLHAEREIELRCGDASIVLTRAGKILIKGNYVLTRSSGANKIKGAYVDIN